jgi:hypothetical protein
VRGKQKNISEVLKTIRENDPNVLAMQNISQTPDMKTGRLFSEVSMDLLRVARLMNE